MSDKEQKPEDKLENKQTGPVQQQQAPVKEKSQHQATAKSGPPKSAASSQASKQKTSPKKFNRMSVVMLTLVALLVIAIGAVAALSVINYRAIAVAHSDSKLLKQRNSDLNNQLNSLQQKLAGVVKQAELLQQATEDTKNEQNYVKDSLKQLTVLVTEKGQDPLLWRFAEVEYLLAIANHRLLLERDVSTAMTALSDADKRLDNIGDPALIPIRKKIADELVALKTVEIPDISGMSVRLSALITSIEKLPLLSRKRDAPDINTVAGPDTVTDWGEFADKILTNLKGIVSLRRTDVMIEPLLPPQELHYLSQNLGLKLEESRLALLRRDTPVFQRHLKDTREWIGRYFDKDSEVVAGVIATVAEFENTELKPALPDISGSLRQLKRWVSENNKQNQAQVPSRTGQDRG